MELLASATVSTVHKDRILTESKPASAIGTLQQSIVTTQKVCSAEKIKLKKLRNEWRKKSSALKSEIDSLNNRSNVGDETRNYKKVESLRQAVTKCEQQISELSSQWEQLYSDENNVDEKYLDEKRRYEVALRDFNKHQNKNKSELSKEQSKLNSLISDLAQLTQKKEKLNKKKEKIGADILQLLADIESLKDQEIQFRIEERKNRVEQRSEKYKLITADVKKYEKLLKNEYQKSYA
ncbi:unnamed protein product [Ambrosiozyma monospora]|uniref:Unnamed protein product n=1 Tax=Ambrosiozyma monospora TaxID=43982 RepID=A0ACB5TDB7_AMBMO|nr:unnamed protein product [Ambrosiozyma monospora]